MPQHLSMPNLDAILFDFSNTERHFAFKGAVKLANAYPNTSLLLNHWGSVDAPDFCLSCRSRRSKGGDSKSGTHRCFGSKGSFYKTYRLTTGFINNPKIKLTIMNLKSILLFFLVFMGLDMSSQENQSDFIDEFRGTASITNNGISLVPSFSLGRPALLFDLKFIKERFSIEPDLRFSLEGKPWSFLLWFRHKAVEKERFSLRVGAHPAINFRTVSILRNEQSEELIETRRYLAAEVVPNYKISEKVSVGMYYLYGRGFDAGVKETNFLVLNSTFTNLQISNQLYMNISPQIYYLTSDDLHGFYTVGYFTLGKKDFLLTISTVLNKAIDTQILPEEDFTWSILLNYTFPRTRNIPEKNEKI